MSYLLLTVYLGILLWVILKSPFYHSAIYPKAIPVLIFLCKFVVGIGVYLVYSKFYNARASSDIFKYFDDGIIIHSAIYENPIDFIRMVTGIGGNAPHLYQYYDTCSFWIKPHNYGLINDNLIVIRFNALVRLISMGNIHIHTLFMAFLSFTGLWAILKIFENHFSRIKWLLLFSVFFFPSLLFWSSGILKEGILMFAFGLLLYHFNKLIQQINYRSFVIFVIAVILLLFSKFYILVSAIPGLLFVLLTQKTKTYFWLKLALSYLLFFVLIWFTKPIMGISFTKILAQKQHDFIAYVNALDYVGSKIKIPEIEPQMFSIVKTIPNAWFNAFFRPTVFEVDNLMMLMAAAENVLIAVILMLMLAFFNKKNLKNPWLWFSISFVLIVFALSGLTTPVLGALVRYKAPALPFLGLIVLYLTHWEKLQKKLKKVQNIFTR